MLEVFQFSQELSDYSHNFSEYAHLLSTAANLFINIDVPSEVRSEVPDLCADVLFHNSNQRDPELFQLGLQRGQRRGLLQQDKNTKKRKTISSHALIVEWKQTMFIHRDFWRHLSAQKSSRSSYSHDHSPIRLPQALCFDDLLICRQTHIELFLIKSLTSRVSD